MIDTDNSKTKPLIILLLGVLGISTSAIIARYSQAPSAITAVYRIGWTVLIMLPVTLLKRETREELMHVDKKAFILSALSGLLLAVHFTSWFESLKNTSVASAAVICCTEVIWVSIGYCVFLKGKLGIKPKLAIAIALIGSVIIAFSDSSGLSGSLFGDLLALVAAIAVSGYTLLGREIRKTTSTAVYTFICYVSCLVCLLIFTMATRTPLTGYGIKSLICGLLLAVFCTIMGHSVFSWALKFFSPSFVSASKLCEPVVSSILAAILFREYPAVLQIVGGIIVIAGVIYYTLVNND